MVRGYTDLEQSRKLAEILPIESADMLFQFGEDKYADSIRVPLTKKHWEQMMPDINPCWSLAALLSVLPDEINDDVDVYRNMFFHLKGKYIIQYPRLTTLWPSLLSVEADNPVDACVAMIEKLNELKLL